MVTSGVKVKLCILRGEGLLCFARTTNGDCIKCSNESLNFPHHLVKGTQPLETHWWWW